MQTSNDDQSSTVDLSYEFIKERSLTLSYIADKMREIAAASILIIDAYPSDLDRAVRSRSTR